MQIWEYFRSPFFFDNQIFRMILLSVLLKRLRNHAPWNYFKLFAYSFIFCLHWRKIWFFFSCQIEFNFPNEHVFRTNFVTKFFHYSKKFLLSTAKKYFSRNGLNFARLFFVLYLTRRWKQNQKISNNFVKPGNEISRWILKKY